MRDAGAEVYGIARACQIALATPRKTGRATRSRSCSGLPESAVRECGAVRRDADAAGSRPPLARRVNSRRRSRGLSIPSASAPRLAFLPRIREPVFADAVHARKGLPGVSRVRLLRLPGGSAGLTPRRTRPRGPLRGVRLLAARSSPPPLPDPASRRARPASSRPSKPPSPSHASRTPRHAIAEAGDALRGYTEPRSAQSRASCPEGAPSPGSRMGSRAGGGEGGSCPAEPTSAARPPRGRPGARPGIRDPRHRSPSRAA